MGAKLAPEGTVTTSSVSEAAVTAAATEPKYTKLFVVTALKLFPRITTGVPVIAVAGASELINGIGVKTKPGKVAIPDGVVIETLPDAPELTVANIVEADTTVNDNEGIPPKLTAVAPVKLMPVMVTTVLGPAVAGLNELMTEGPEYIKPGRAA